MDDIRIVTNVDKIRNYKTQCCELAKVVQPLLEKKMTSARKAQTTLYTTHPWIHDGNHFVFSIHAKRFKAQSRIYKMIPTPTYFEAVVYEPDIGMYYLFDHHFFERYAGRMSIKHFSHPDILKHYVEHNPVIVFGDRRKGLLKSGSKKLYGRTRQGLIHAEQEHTNVMVLYTFISGSTLTAKQRKSSRSLWFRLNKRSNAPLG